jgi:high-affinity iron transporter
MCYVADPMTALLRRIPWWTPLVLVGAGLVWLAAHSSGGVPDPTDPSSHLSTGAVVVDSALLVFREGLESILVLAAVLASFLGTNTAYRRPVAGGAGVGILATVGTWFLAVWLLGALGGGGLDVQAATGLLAVVVLLVVMNWFFHRVYWTGWIAHHHGRRRRLLASADHAGVRATLLGFGLLGFTSVYREGFEIVVFLQNLRLRAGDSTVLAGVGLGVLLTAIVGLITFRLHHKLPYKRMLVLTGVLLGVVLVVMVGESVQELQLAGWIPTTTIGVNIPGWAGLWFALFPTVEGLGAQVLAAGAVLGSYFVAEHLKVRRPKRRGERPAVRPTQPAIAVRR